MAQNQGYRGLLGIGRARRLARRQGRRGLGSSTTSAPNNQKSVTATKTAPENAPGSVTAVNMAHQNAAAGTNRPPTLQQSQQIQQEFQQSAAANDTTDYSGQLDELLAGQQKPGIFNFRQKKAQNAFRQAVESAKQGGVTREELQGLQQQVGSPQYKKFEKGAQQFQTGTSAALGKMLEQGAPGAQGTTPAENPFLTGNVRAEYQPQVQNIENQMMTEAEQQAASEQAQKEYAQGIDTNVQATQQRAGQNIEGLQQEATSLHDQFTSERQALSEKVAGLPDEIKRQYDADIEGFQQKIDSAQGIIDTKESAALSGVMAGKSQAMAASVQATQGQVNQMVAQIQSNPNLTDSQKQQMIAQTKLQGAMQTGPMVGQTVLQFNELAAQTAVAFGNMTTQIQTTGLQGMANLYEQEAKSFADSSIAAAQLGGQLLQTQANADNNYITAQSNLESTRANIDMMGDQLRASLIPEMGVPYPQYSNAMMTGLQMDFDLAKQEFNGIMGMYGYQMAAWQAQQQAKGGLFQTIAAIGGTIGGPAGQALMGVGMLGGQVASNQNPAPQLPGMGGYSQAANANQFGLDMSRIS